MHCLAHVIHPPASKRWVATSCTVRLTLLAGCIHCSHDDHLGLALGQVVHAVVSRGLCILQQDGGACGEGDAKHALHNLQGSTQQQGSIAGS